jgi:sugar phosphate isomerase/epimerase
MVNGAGAPPFMQPLGYSTNLHAAETVEEIAAALGAFAADARNRLEWPVLGVDLRLGARAIADLAEAGPRDALRRALDANRLAAHTINGFPLGRFQAEVVKRDAYRPDWVDAERLAASVALLDIALALSDAPLVTISTVPGSYRPFGAERNDPAAIAANLGRWAAAAARRKRDTGRTVVLCPEPEPWCFLETSWDVAWFWQGPLAEHGLAACADDLDGDVLAARAALAGHLGVCVDTCHLSLAFEDQAAAVARMRAAGARIAKCQVSAAPEVANPHADPDGVADLRALAEPRFLHQTAARSASGSQVRVEDLDELDACLARLPGATTVRSHFHIPLFREPTERGLSSTVADSVTGLRACLAAGCTHVSVETYTWSVLEKRERDALDGTVRELEFLRGAVDGMA